MSGGIRAPDGGSVEAAIFHVGGHQVQVVATKMVNGVLTPTDWSKLSKADQKTQLFLAAKQFGAIRPPNEQELKATRTIKIAVPIILSQTIPPGAQHISPHSLKSTDRASAQAFRTPPSIPSPQSNPTRAPTSAYPTYPPGTPVNHSFDQASQRIAYNASHPSQGPGPSGNAFENTKLRDQAALASLPFSKMTTPEKMQKVVEMSQQVEGVLKNDKASGYDLFLAYENLGRLQDAAEDPGLRNDPSIKTQLESLKRSNNSQLEELTAKVKAHTPELSKWFGISSVTIEDALTATLDDIRKGNLGGKTKEKVIGLLNEGLFHLAAKINLGSDLHTRIDDIGTARKIMAKLDALGASPTRIVKPLQEQFEKDPGIQFEHDSAKINELIAHKPPSGVALFEAAQLNSKQGARVAAFKASLKKYKDPRQIPIQDRVQLKLMTWLQSWQQNRIMTEIGKLPSKGSSNSASNVANLVTKALSNPGDKKLFAAAQKAVLSFYGNDTRGMDGITPFDKAIQNPQMRNLLTAFITKSPDLQRSMPLALGEIKKAAQPTPASPSPAAAPAQARPEMRFVPTTSLGHAAAAAMAQPGPKLRFVPASNAAPRFIPASELAAKAPQAAAPIQANRPAAPSVRSKLSPTQKNMLLPFMSPREPLALVELLKKSAENAGGFIKATNELSKALTLLLKSKNPKDLQIAKKVLDNLENSDSSTAKSWLNGVKEDPSFKPVYEAFRKVNPREI